MSATQLAENDTTLPTTKTGNGAKRVQTRRARTAPATAIRTDAPGQSTASRTAAATAAQALARAQRTQAAANAAQMGRTPLVPVAGMAAPPAIVALFGELPGQAAGWTATDALSFLGAFCPLMCHEYKLGGQFSVSYTPANA